MKKKYVLVGVVAIVAATQMFTACSSEEFDSQSVEQPVQGNTISLTSAMQGATRAVSDPQTTQLNTAVKVGVFGISSDAPIANGNNNPYSVEANGDLTAATEMVWPAEGSVSLYAYAPYQEGWTYNNDHVFTVATNQTTDAGYLASDLVYGTPTTNPVAQTEDAIALNFKHKLAKLNITIQKTEGAELDLAGGTVTINNTKVATTFNPSTGNVGEAAGDVADIAVVSALGTATTACAIIVPQQVAAGTQLVTIVADGKQLLAKLGTATTFVGGKSYNFTVKVGKVTDPVTEVTLVLGSTGIASWDDEDLGSTTGDEPTVEPLTATFGTPGNNATYEAPTYTWTGSTSNLMTVFEFANGELANYSKLTFTFSNLVDGPVRMGYYVGSTFTEFGNGYYSAGTKTVNLTALGIDLSTVTKISFGGRSNAGSCDILASDVILSKE
ncbi:MAG: fimbrillin family protein [Prevotella sp.]|nr:fimbrillin family protein [Prevotella sp.]